MSMSAIADLESAFLQVNEADGAARNDDAEEADEEEQEEQEEEEEEEIIAAAAVKRNPLCEKFFGNWDDRHGRDWKKMHLFFCFLLFFGSVGFLPFEHARALLVVDEVQGRTSIELTAPLLEHAVEPASVALLLLDEVRQALSLTVWDFRSNFLRFGAANGVHSPALFVSSNEHPPFMFLSSCGARAEALADGDGGISNSSPAVIRMSVSYQLVTLTPVVVADGSSSTSSTSASSASFPSTSDTVITNTTFSSTAQTTTFEMTAASATTATSTSTVKSSSSIITPVGGYGEMGCTTVSSLSSAEPPHCFFVDKTKQRRTFDLRLKRALSAQSATSLAPPALTRRQIVWSEAVLPSATLVDGSATVWGELAIDTSSSPPLPPLEATTSTTTAGTVEDNATQAMAAAQSSTMMTTSTTASSSPTLTTANGDKNTTITIQLHAPLWLSPQDRDPVIFASATANVQRWQRIFISEFERAMVQQNPGIVGVWLDRRGPTTAGTLVAWSKGYVDRLYNASDTPYDEVNNLVLQLLRVNGGLLPQHSVTLSDSRGDQTVFVCRVVAPHWLTVTVIPEKVVLAAPQMQQFASRTTTEKEQLLSQTVAVIPLAFFLAVFLLLMTVHGLKKVR